MTVSSHATPIRAKAVIFDVGHTLIFPNDAFFYELAQEYQSRLSPDAFRKLGARCKEKAYRENPINPYKKWITEWYISAGVESRYLPEIYDAIHRRHEQRQLWDTLEPSLPDVLVRLREQGFKLGVISNADGTVRQLLEDFELDHYFKCILDSTEVGIEKPDARIFFMAAQMLGVVPEACVYIGDHWQVDGQGALHAGMIPVILDPFDVGKEIPCLKIRRLMDILKVVQLAED